VLSLKPFSEARQQLSSFPAACKYYQKATQVIPHPKS